MLETQKQENLQQKNSLGDSPRPSRKRLLSSTSFSSSLDLFRKDIDTGRAAAQSTVSNNNHSSNNAKRENSQSDGKMKESNQCPASHHAERTEFLVPARKSRGMYREQEIARQRNQKQEEKERLVRTVQKSLALESSKLIREDQRNIEAAVKMSPHVKEPAMEWVNHAKQMRCSENEDHILPVWGRGLSLAKRKNKQPVLYKIP